MYTCEVCGGFTDQIYAECQSCSRAFASRANLYNGPHRKCTCAAEYGQCKACLFFVCGECYNDPDRKRYCQCYAGEHGWNGFKRHILRSRLLRKITPEPVPDKQLNRMEYRHVPTVADGMPPNAA